MNLDLADSSSLHAAFDQIGPFDELVVATGDVAFNAFEAMTDEEWAVGMNGKLMGQINATRAAIEYLNPNGCHGIAEGSAAQRGQPLPAGREYGYLRRFLSRLYPGPGHTDGPRPM